MKYLKLMHLEEFAYVLFLGYCSHLSLFLFKFICFKRKSILLFFSFHRNIECVS